MPKGNDRLIGRIGPNYDMAGIETFLDRMLDRQPVAAQAAKGPVASPGPLPTSIWQAMGRGAVNRCPSCASQKLFPRYLKPIAQCRSCGQDWTPQQADDFPAYIAIIVTGHVMAPIIIALVGDAALPLWALSIIIMTLAISMVGALLQPAKGAVIATQYWMGLHGFEKSPRPDRTQGD